MTPRNAVRVMKRVVRLWPLWFLILWSTIMIIFATSSLDSYVSNLTFPLPAKGLNKGSFVEDINSILKEELIGQQSGHSLVLRTSGVKMVQLINAYQVRSIFAEDITYHRLQFDDKVYVTEATNLSDSKLNGNKDEIQTYFELIRTKTGYCRKLVRVGGTLNCGNRGDNNWMDGHKILCLDPTFQIIRLKITDCVVLSFGIHLDTTFDEGMAELKCEVYMYDTGNYTKPYFRKENHLHFHPVGLDIEKSTIFNSVYNVTQHFDNLNNIVLENDIEDKLINVLKVDIEGYEWKILYDISSKPYMDLIGQSYSSNLNLRFTTLESLERIILDKNIQQPLIGPTCSTSSLGIIKIAIEVHAIELLKLKDEEKRKKAKYYTGAIKALEERGFRIVFYWNNFQPKYVYTDADGQTYETAGEMLLINYNWYNETFREELRKRGYNFENL